MKNMTKFGLLPVAAIVTVAAGTLMGAGSAEAQLQGSTEYDGDSTSLTSSDSEISSGGKIEFTGLGAIELQMPTTGDFLNFDGAKIFGLDPVPGAFSPGVKFLDFGTGDVSSDTSYDDGQNAFFVTKAFDFDLKDVGSFGTFIGLKLAGFFLDDSGNESKGEATLTWQTGTDFDTVDGILAGTIDGSFTSAFSGLTVASVPEPATMLGLGVVAGAGFLASRRKHSEA
jgi:hypothetical protein